MQILIVEDDFISRKLIQKYLSPYGECHIAVNGKEALLAVEMGREEGKPYAVVALDIMMPGMDGQQVLEAIRYREDSLKLPSSERTKIIMTTALSDPKQIVKSYKALCEEYLIKPIEKEQIDRAMNNLGFKKN